MNTLKQSRGFAQHAAAILALCVLCLAAVPALAAGFPQRPVTLIVPYPPGGTSDNVARSLQKPLGDALGVPIIVRNISGSAGTIGTSALANAKPDGYTIGINTNATVTTSPQITPVDYSIDSFTPIARVAISYLGLALRKNFPASNFKQFIQYAKTHPVTVSDTGIGANTHLCVEALKEATGTKIIQVPFKGSSPSINAVVNGHIDAICDPSILHPAQNKILKPLITLTPERWSEIPKTPTYKEVTGKEFPVQNWYTALAPKGTPAGVINKLQAAFKKTANDPKLIAQYRRLGIKPYYASSKKLDEQLHAEYETRRHVLERLHLVRQQ